MEEEKNTNKGNLKKMLSWSSDSDDSENEDGENKDTTKVPNKKRKDSELKSIEKQVITQRRALNVVTEPQTLNRKVDKTRISPKYLRVKIDFPLSFFGIGTFKIESINSFSQKF